jgi:hypothetical protein
MRCPVAALSRELQLQPAVCDVQDAAVSLSSGGQLGYRCHKCGASGWLVKGSRSYARRAELFTADETDVPAPAPVKPAPSPIAAAARQVATAPAAPVKRPAFAMFGSDSK